MTCEHCGESITRRRVGAVWLHVATGLMGCGPFYASRGRPVRTPEEGQQS